MNHSLKKLIFFAAITILVAACYNDKYAQLYPVKTTTTICDTTTVSYATDLVPIINASCAISGGCHDAAGKSVSGYDFTTYAGLQQVANATVLLNDLNWTPVGSFNDMPKNAGKLSSCDINKFTAWVNQGALNN
jgi:hypothetical protein